WKVHITANNKHENFHNYPPDQPNYVNIESPPSLHPCKRICDITGFEVCDITTYSCLMLGLICKFHHIGNCYC
ncbi:hypothetical protein CFOL_v3_30295, partial [Cephalotus follicularis]